MIPTRTIPALVLALALSACDSKQQEELSKSTADALDKAKVAAEAAGGAAADAAAGFRTKFTEGWSKVLDGIDLPSISAKIAALTGDAKPRAEALFQSLTEEYASIQDKAGRAATLGIEEIRSLLTRSDAFKTKLGDLRRMLGM